MSDLCAAILARCDELEKLADAAEPSRTSRWMALPPGTLSVTSARLDEDCYPVDIAEAATPEAAAFMDELDPDFVRHLVAGAREMCAIHVPTTKYSETGFPYCDGCAGPPDGCRTLELLAKMLRVDIP